MERINVEFDIRSKTKLRDNVRYNYPITPGLPHDTTLYIINIIKITYSEVKIIRKKTNHKELISFLYGIGLF